MKPTSVTINVDVSQLSSFDDAYLASLWHVSQINPAPFGSEAACEFADDLRVEIVRRWLAAVPAPLNSHRWDHVDSARRMRGERGR